MLRYANMFASIYKLVWGYAQIIFKTGFPGHGFSKRILQFGQMELDQPQNYACKYIEKCIQSIVRVCSLVCQILDNICKCKCIKRTLDSINNSSVQSTLSNSRLVQLINFNDKILFINKLNSNRNSTIMAPTK